jgi:DNA polymerase-3 subunit gamma/tau
MLGSLDQKTVRELIQVLAAKDASGVLQQIALLSEQNPDFVTVLGDILSLLQQIAIAQVVPTAVDTNQPDSEAILQLAQQLSPEEVQLFYQIGLLGRRDLPLAPEQRGGFEMVMLRMLAFRPDTTLEQQPPQTIQQQPPQNRPQTPPSTSAHSPTVTTPTNSQTAPLAQVLSNNDEWGNIVHSLGLQGFVKQLALNCKLKERKEDIWHFTLSSDNKLLLTESRKRKIEEVLQKQYNSPKSIHICVERETETSAVQQQDIQESRQQYIVKAAENDPFIIYLKENCGARMTIK